MTINMVENIKKTMGWCPNVYAGHASMAMPEIEIKNLKASWFKAGKNLCSKDIEILLIALVWASVILAISNVLRGTIYMNQILPILGGGSFASILITSNMRKKK